MWRERYGSKYGSKSQVYNGRSYHSKLEAGYAMELDLRKKAGDILGWIPQVMVNLDVKGKHICKYYVDFKILHKDGTEEFVEVKGFATEVWRLKWRLFEALFGDDPTVKLTVVK